MMELSTHLLYVAIFLKIYFLGRKNTLGWVFAIIADIGWIAVGFLLPLYSMVMWHVGFMVMSIIGYRNWKPGYRDTEFDSGHTEHIFEVHWHRWNPMPGVEPPETEGCYIATLLSGNTVAQGTSPMDAVERAARVARYRENPELFRREEG